MQRPGDDETVPLERALRWQQEYVRARGAPVAALILDAVAEDVRDAGPLSRRVPGAWRFGDLPGLRIMGTVHRLALARQAPAVALHLPTLGGRAPDTPRERTSFARAVVDALLDHPDALAEGLARTPQTNETGRAALLRIALSRMASRPVALVELGTSAGLNLRADHLPGLPGLEAGPLPTIVSRFGCDRAPIDPLTPEGRLDLSSFVWVDDVERFARLGRALDVARRVPATVVAGEAADVVESWALVEGVLTVVWHSAFWLYLSPGERDRVDRGLDRLGRASTRDGGLARVAWEWEAGSGDRFALSCTTWRDGRAVTEVIARGASHGQEVVLVA